MVVAVHEDLRLGEVDREDALEHGVELGGFGVGEGDALVAGDVPLGEELQLAQQQCAVVLGQYAGAACTLDGGERAERVGVEVGGAVEVGLLARGRVQGVQVGGRAEVGEQQETMVEVLREHFGHVGAGSAEEFGHVQPGAHVFLFGRGVHDDARGAAVGEAGAEVAPEARVGRGRGEVEGLAGQGCGEPGPELFETMQTGSPRTFV